MTTLELLLLCMVVAMSLTIMYLIFHLDKSEKEIVRAYTRRSEHSQKYHAIEGLFLHALALLFPQRYENPRVKLLFTQTKILIGENIIRNAQNMECYHEYEKAQCEET